MLVEWQFNQTDGIMRAKLDAAVYALCLGHHCLAAGSQKGNLSVFDESFNLLRFVKISNFPIYDLLWVKDQWIIASGDGWLRVFNADFELIRQVKISNKNLRQVIEVDQGFAVACSEGKITILDEEFQIDDVLDAHEGTVFALAYLSGEQKLFSGGKDAHLNFYHQNKIINRISAHLLHVHSIATQQGSSYVLSSSMDKEIRVWDANDGHLLKVVNLAKQGAHRSSVNKILWFAKNNFISCSDDRTIMCFEIQE